jgi:hypothetical protein
MPALVFVSRCLIGCAAITLGANAVHFHWQGPAGIDKGATNNWLLPDGAAVDNKATAADSTDKGAPPVRGHDGMARQTFLSSSLRARHETKADYAQTMNGFMASDCITFCELILPRSTAIAATYSPMLGVCYVISTHVDLMFSFGAP